MEKKSGPPLLMSKLGKTLLEMVRELKTKGKYPLERDRKGRMVSPRRTR